MKIVKSKSEADKFKALREKANEGCRVCPCCGETRTTSECFINGEQSAGLFYGLVCKRWARGLFRTKYYQIDCYHCYTCGAEWESEPYRTA